MTFSVKIAFNVGDYYHHYFNVNDAACLSPHDENKRKSERIGDSMKFLIVCKLISIDIVNVHCSNGAFLDAWHGMGKFKAFLHKKGF